MTLWDAFPSYAFYAGMRFEAWGDRMRKQVGASNLPWGITKAPRHPTLAEGTGGNVDAGVYKVFAVGETADGSRGMPYTNTPGSITIASDNAKILVTNLPVFSDPQIVHVVVFRSPKDMLNPFMYAGRVRNGSTSITLNGADESLPTEDVLEPPEMLADDETAYAGPFRYEKPPAKSRCFSFDGRLWAFGEKDIRPGMISATVDSEVMTISGGDMPPAAKGKYIVIDGEEYGYLISEVLSASTVRVEQPYQLPNWRSSAPAGEPFVVRGYANNIHFSETDRPDYFPWTNVLKVGQESGGSLMAGCDYMGEAILFTEGAVYAIYPTSDPLLPYARRKTLSPVGCPAANSVVNAGDAIYFFSGEHFYRYSNNGAVRIDFDQGDLGSIANPQHIVGTKIGDRVVWAISSGAGEWFDRIVVYDLGGWWDAPWVDLRVVDLAAIIEADGRHRLYLETKAGSGYALQVMDSEYYADGIVGDYSGTVTRASSNTLTCDTIAFPTADLALQGIKVEIVEGTGLGQIRYIQSNTAHTLTLDDAWVTIPAATSIFTIGAIRWDFVGGRLTFGRPHDEKTYDHLEIGFGGAE